MFVWIVNGVTDIQVSRMAITDTKEIEKEEKKI